MVRSHWPPTVSYFLTTLRYIVPEARPWTQFHDGGAAMRPHKTERMAAALAVHDEPELVNRMIFTHFQK